MEDHLARYPDLMSNPDLARTGVVLARARMLAGDNGGAAELADTALEAVEHFDLLEEIADAMVTRGTALVATRNHQGMALLRGALRMCEEHDLTSTGLRAMINIGYGSADFEEGRQMTWRAYEEAKRIGDRGHARFAAGNSLGWLMESLRLAEIDDLLADPIFIDVPPTDEIGLHTTRAEVALMRGNRQEALEDLATARAMTRDITDHQALEFIEGTHRLLDLLDGDYGPVHETALRRFHEVSFTPWISAYVVINAAAQAANREWLPEAIEIVRQVPHSKMMAILANWGEAMLALLDGQSEQALQMIEEAANEAHDQDLIRTEFFILASAVRLVPNDHPRHQVFIDRARTIATDTGAHGLFDWLELSL
jgi:tetratricopeptide (TPR) repeat protein